jgi:arylsulfatase A-like enzyme
MRLMTPEQVARSYEVDRSWVKMWSYTFGLADYTSEELEVMAATYDAALLELDDLFRELVTSLGAAGRLDNTIVVLTSDHGEHLGEHHMLDHQYSVYQGLLHVPLILHHPPAVHPGRDDRPVTNRDLHPTLLSMALGAAAEPGSGRNLLQPDGESRRMAEYPAPFAGPIETVRRVAPGFDPTPYQRRLRALFEGRYKLIWGSDGRHALFDIVAAPDETRDIRNANPELTSRLLAELDRIVAGLAAYCGSEELEEPSEELRERLQALGYAEPRDR